MSLRIDPKGLLRPDPVRKQEEARKELHQAAEKAASGRRINRAADDAAGLAISQTLGEEIRGLRQGLTDLYDGMSLVQTADGALDSMGESLHRMRELALAAAGDATGPEQRLALDEEFRALKDELDRVTAATAFGGHRLLDGSAGEIRIATGQGGGEAQVIALDLGANMDTQSLGLAQARLDGTDGRSARDALEDVDHALQSLAGRRAELGAEGNRLVGAQRDVAVAMETTLAARSRVQDADLALESSRQVSRQILSQAPTAVQAQAQGLAGTVLNLLR
ncbi:MAG: flagellin [Candidatus Krumholzibacteriia bacterium]